MSKVLGGALVVAVFWMATGCVDRAAPGSTGTKTPDSAGVDTTARPDTVTPHDSATPPDTATQPDIAIPPDRWTPDTVLKPDTGGPTTSKWVVSAGGTSNELGSEIALDGSGNIYLIGHYSVTASFGNTTLTSKGDVDVFVTKLDRGGRFLWAVSAGGSRQDWGQSIAADSSGNCIITGGFQATATFGSTTPNYKGIRDIFVAKLDRGGKFLWAVSAGGGRDDGGKSIAVDGSGNSTITGNFGDWATFGSTTLYSIPWDMYVARVDQRGKFVWAVSDEATAMNHGHAVALDGSGNSYVTGDFGGTASFGNSALTSKGSWDVFVAKVDRGGKFVWALSAGGSRHDTSYAIAADGSGNSYLTGFFNRTATFGSTTLTSRGDTDLFVAKVDSGGKFAWAVSAGGVAGDSCHSIALDSSRNSYVVGRFRGTATFGSTTLTSRGGGDILLAKVDSVGRFVSAVSAGGIASDYGGSIALDSSGNIYITGGFSETATFGSTTLTSKGDHDVFVAKLDKSGKF